MPSIVLAREAPFCVVTSSRSVTYWAACYCSRFWPALVPLALLAHPENPVRLARPAHKGLLVKQVPKGLAVNVAP